MADFFPWASLPLAAAMGFAVLFFMVLSEGRGYAGMALAAFLAFRAMMSLLPLWAAPDPATLAVHAWVAAEAFIYAGVSTSLLLFAFSYGLSDRRSPRLTWGLVALGAAFVSAVAAWPRLYGLPAGPRGPLSLVLGVMFAAFAVGGVVLLRRAESAPQRRRTVLLLMAGAFVLTPGPDLGRTAYLLLAPPSGWALGTMALKALAAGALVVFSVEAFRMRERVLAFLPGVAAIIGFMTAAFTDSYVTVLTPTVRLAAAAILAYAFYMDHSSESSKRRTRWGLAFVVLMGWTAVEAFLSDLLGATLAMVLAFLALGSPNRFEDVMETLLKRNAN